MIYDCFLFYNELELLDLRLMVLNDVVDYFVLVEADKTFTGNPKEFIFEQNKGKYLKYLDKIIYVKVTDTPEKDGAWNIEEFQRNCISRGLEGAKEGDKILISDVDEIPNPDRIMEHENNPNPVTFVQKLFYYYVNCLSAKEWFGTIMSPYGYEGLSPQRLRGFARSGLNKVQDGGWHYSYIGGVEMVKNKLRNLSDAYTTIDQIGSEEDITRKHSELKDLWEDTKYILIDPKDCGPRQIDKFIRRYPHVFYNRAS